MGCWHSIPTSNQQKHVRLIEEVNRASQNFHKLENCTKHKRTLSKDYPYASSPSHRRQRSLTITEKGPTKETSTLVSGYIDQRKYMNQYVIERELGAGSFGKVKLVKNTDDLRHYAMKVFKKSRLLTRKRGLKKGCLDDVYKEITIMKQICHKNIIRCYEVINDPTADHILLVMFYAERGPTMKPDWENPPLPISFCKQYFCNVLCGLNYLHSKRIIHRDIKPENLLVGEDGFVRISDFGSALIIPEHSNVEGEVLFQEKLRQTVGSPAFLPPELCAIDLPFIVATAIDVWAFGVTMYFFIFGTAPFRDETEIHLYDRIRTQKLTFPKEVDSDITDLLSKLLTKEPKDRIAISALKHHPWIKDYQDKIDF